MLDESERLVVRSGSARAVEPFPDTERVNELLLLERQGETARIESALARARSGNGSYVVVEGPAGIGKTALLGAARTAAAETGMRVLWARGTELERDFSFGVVRQLFEPALVEATEEERANLLQAEAGAAAGLLGLPGGDDAPSSRVDPSFAIPHGLYWLCANLAATTPLCIVVDDAHWADAPSLRFLAFLLTRLDELEVALVVATRPREEGTDTELLATVTSDPSADLIHLPPLTRAAVAQARRVQARRGAGPGLRRRVLPRDEGNAVPRPRARRGAERARGTGDRRRRAPGREDRRTDDRPLGAAPPEPAAAARGAARPRARDPRAERSARGRAPRGARRGRGGRRRPSCS